MVTYVLTFLLTVFSCGNICFDIFLGCGFHVVTYVLTCFLHVTYIHIALVEQSRSTVLDFQLLIKMFLVLK